MFTVDQIVRITEEYAELDTALYVLAKKLQELGYSKFARYGNSTGRTGDPTWFVYEIGSIDPTTKVMEVTFGGWVGDSREEFEVKIPILWLQLEDPTEEIKFHMELAN